jgi:hypothetical protein
VRKNVSHARVHVSMEGMREEQVLAPHAFAASLTITRQGLDSPLWRSRS